MFNSSIVSPLLYRVEVHARALRVSVHAALTINERVHQQILLPSRRSHQSSPPKGQLRCESLILN